MIFQIGEVLNADIASLMVIGVRDDEGRTRVVLKYRDEAGELQLELPADSGIRFTRSVPADGVPTPGETWADQLGQVYFARVGYPGGVNLVNADEPGSSGQQSWESVHRGLTGPIYRVATRPDLQGGE